MVFNAHADGHHADGRRRSPARRYRLHPVQASGGDPVVRAATADRGAFTVPGRTVAVFVSDRGRGH